MYKAIMLPLAKDDVKEAALWYNKQQAGLGKRFTLKFVRKSILSDKIRKLHTSATTQ